MTLSTLLHLQPPTYERKKNYDFSNDLGTGTYGTVKKAWSRSAKKDVAVKVILKKTVKGHEDMVHKEIDVLKDLNHPNIVNFLDWFESRDKYYLVFDLATGGELFDRICEQGRFTENNAATIMKEVIQAVEYLHSKNVVHRDLKPENLLYENERPDSKLMLVDFGISKVMDSDDQVLTTMCGSYGYAAPEVLLRRGHGKPVDMWSIGVITYTLLCGYAPFQAETDQQLVSEIARCNVVFHERYWRDVSVEARDFIKCLLRASPEKRLTATEALQHKWITTETGTDVDLLDNVREGFNAKKMFRKTVKAVAMINRLRSITARNNTDGEASTSEDASSSISGQSAVSTPVVTSPPS
ncbi:MAG: kinase-like domain-containing protein [Benniella sp.]|nr:MAG: kinase-like domain-containing protein [Benniella sp.]